MSASSGTATTSTVPTPRSSSWSAGLLVALVMIRGSRSVSMPTSSGTSSARSIVVRRSSVPSSVSPTDECDCSDPLAESHMRIPALVQPTMRGSASLTTAVTAAESVAAESSWARASSASARTASWRASSSAMIRSSAAAAWPA